MWREIQLSKNGRAKGELFYLWDFFSVKYLYCFSASHDETPSLRHLPLFPQSLFLLFDFFRCFLLCSTGSEILLAFFPLLLVSFWKNLKFSKLFGISFETIFNGKVVVFFFLNNRFCYIKC